MAEHTKWLVDTGTELDTSDGKKVKVINLQHLDDENLLLGWAKHLREHYILDSEIEDACQPTGLSKSDYLKKLKFPSANNPGPSIKAGDFSEILVADYLEFVLDYIVPRTRYDNKINRDSSPMGIDVLAFKMGPSQSPADELITCEVKASLVNRSVGRFQKALNDSVKDYNFRKAEALNAMRQRLKEKNNLEKVAVVDRFQDITDRPYKEISAAALVVSNHCWNDEDISGASINHPNSNLRLFTIKGDYLMDLTKKLYKIAHDSA